ncbi:MAG: polyphosphate kinase 2 [Gammaproteobacteria bacterium]|nr:polyphosphate kinase 2 [Gammaproteobacteria bacterium]
MQKLERKKYEKALIDLQVAISRIQTSVVKTGLRVVIVVEGRDAAGKGGAIKRLIQWVSPRVFRVVALPAPTDREKSQLYLQRFVQHFPAAGEIVVFDRSWYNRAGVERVMGFCTESQYRDFFVNCPLMESAIVHDGIILLKYFFDVSAEEQHKRFEQRIADPRKHWKVSELDLESKRRWDNYTAAYNDMFAATDTEFAPWYVVPADDKRRARLNFLSHLISHIPHEDEKFNVPDLPQLSRKIDGERPNYTRVVPQRF